MWYLVVSGCPVLPLLWCLFFVVSLTGGKAYAIFRAVACFERAVRAVTCSVQNSSMWGETEMNWKERWEMNLVGEREGEEEIWREWRRKTKGDKHRLAQRSSGKEQQSAWEGYVCWRDTVSLAACHISRASDVKKRYYRMCDWCVPLLISLVSLPNRLCEWLQEIACWCSEISNESSFREIEQIAFAKK